MVSIAAACLVVAMAATSDEPGGEPIGRVVALSGEVFVTPVGGARAPAVRGVYLREGDLIETGAGKVRLLMTDKSVLSLTADSRLQLTTYRVRPAEKRRNARLTVLAGRLWALVSQAVHPEARYEVESGNAVAGVRGTELVVDADPSGGAAVTVLAGVVELASPAAQETLGARELGRVAEAGAIAIASASEAGVVALRAAARPAQALDAAAAAKRLQALRKRGEATSDSGPVDLRDGQAADRDEPGTGAATFEDTEMGTNAGESRDQTPGLNYFDPSTQARVFVSVEVRP